ncbi:MAG: aldehyde dehydrogenase family protein, partial [Clostridiales bacterium]|nr:aldehyde dehydrogenase family protein [Clostridiales bacterium]
MENYQKLVKKQKLFFDTGKTKNIDYRLKALHKLRAGIKRNEDRILEALKVDLNKSEYEAYTCEIGYVLEEI